MNNRMTYFSDKEKDKDVFFLIIAEEISHSIWYFFFFSNFYCQQIGHKIIIFFRDRKIEINFTEIFSQCRFSI